MHIMNKSHTVFSGKQRDKFLTISIFHAYQKMNSIQFYKASDPDALSTCLLKDKFYSEINLGSNP